MSLAIGGTKRQFDVIPVPSRRNLRAFLSAECDQKGNFVADKVSSSDGPVVPVFAAAESQVVLPAGALDQLPDMLPAAPEERNKGGRPQKVSYAFKAGLTLSKMPPGCKGIKRRLKQFSNAIDRELRLMFAGRKPGVMIYALAQTACRQELRALFNYKMILDNPTAKPEMKTLWMKEGATASMERDKVLQKMGLGSLCKPPEAIDPWFVEATPAKKLAPAPYKPIPPDVTDLDPDA